MSNKSLIYAVLIMAAILSLGPFYWMFVNATQPSEEIFRVPPHFLPGSHLIENFGHLEKEISISKAVRNSLVTTGVYTVLSVLISAMAGYGFAKFRFWGRDKMFFLLLASMMIPYQVTLIPLFQMMVKLEWLNTWQAVILPTLANPFGIYLMRQNIKAIPDELLEAARVDGCGEVRIFFTVVLPVMRPALAALSIFMFMAQWNSFIWPLLVLNTKEMYTLPVALSTLVGYTRIDYGQVMLGTTLSTLPIMVIFLILQRQFISGILGGSVKG